MSTRLVLAAGLLLLPACTAPGGSDDAASEPDTAATAASELPTGDGPGCGVVDDCEAAPVCETVACVDGLCVYTPRPADERSDDLSGDCHSQRCDGAGGASPVPDPDDLPDDANACTRDECSAAGDPDNVPLAPGNPCPGGFCHPDLSCQPCAERDGCSDESPAEPNETQGNAHPLPTLRDDAGLAYVCEALGSPGDVDWFTLDTLDVILGKVAPKITVDPAGPNVCVYFQCKQGSTGVTCPEGTTASNAPLGQQGCCGGATFEPAIDCNGFDEDATMWLKVSRPAEPALPDCLNYQLGYEY